MQRKRPAYSPSHKTATELRACRCSNTRPHARSPGRRNTCPIPMPPPPLLTHLNYPHPRAPTSHLRPLPGRSLSPPTTVGEDSLSAETAEDTFCGRPPRAAVQVAEPVRVHRRLTHRLFRGSRHGGSSTEFAERAAKRGTPRNARGTGMLSAPRKAEEG